MLLGKLLVMLLGKQAFGYVAGEASRYVAGEVAWEASGDVAGETSGEVVRWYLVAVGAGPQLSSWLETRLGARAGNLSMWLFLMMGQVTNS